MVLTIEDHPNALIELLWIREAWNLRTTGIDLPPLLSDTTVGEDAAARAVPDQITQWREAWPALWKRCVDHVGHVRQDELLRELHETANGSAERADLLRRLVGPDWRDTFGSDAFTPQYQSWTAAGFEAGTRGQTRPLGETPERVSLEALIVAWRAGLTKIVTIPCAGTFTRQIGQHVLLVTAETRDDPRRYSAALTHFH